ncbi:MAG: hypothetical protein HYZ81_03625 [Nitrospinae bacterium]|nr:hypothetical protein [Nitrospinota bacterium]
MAGLIEQRHWKTALEGIRTAQTIFFLGASDSGKTTFLTWVANALHAQGRRVCVVDTDVGQSSVGPPTTIGLGLVSQQMQRAQELVPVSLYFVGATSPRGHLLPMLVGTKRLADHGRALGMDHVLIDTSGFVSGPVGRTLKQHKISLVAPDVVICLQRADECEGILQAYRRTHTPQILRLEASVACRQRSVGERRAYRARALQRYFARAKPLTLQWDALNLIDTPLWYGVPLTPEAYTRLVPPEVAEVLWVEHREDELFLVTRERLASRHTAEIAQAEGMRVRTRVVGEWQGTLLGLLDEAGETLGLGLLQCLDFARHHMVIRAPHIEQRIAGIHWSRTRLGPHGELLQQFPYIPQCQTSPAGDEQGPPDVGEKEGL